MQETPNSPETRIPDNSNAREELQNNGPGPQTDWALLQNGGIPYGQRRGAIVWDEMCLFRTLFEKSRGLVLYSIFNPLPMVFHQVNGIQFINSEIFMLNSFFAQA